MLKIKNYVLWVACALFLLSCNDSSNTSSPANNDPPSGSIDVAVISKDEALAMAKRNGCLACHSIEKKVVGPAWEDVSYRYQNDPGIFNVLVEKVKNGGKGAWGQVPMPPYFPRVSEDEIRKLISFILGLDGITDGTGLRVDAAPLTLELMQGERLRLSFSSFPDITFTNRVDISMTSGIVDMSVEEVNGSETTQVGQLTGIDGQGTIGALPTGKNYYVYITAQTDAQFSVSASLESTNSNFISLAKTSGCFACHSVDDKVVGPAWRDVGDRYKGDADALAILIEKVKAGGEGAWGQLPMPPYSPRVSDTDIQFLVSSILALEGGSGALPLTVNASNPLVLDLKQGKSVHLVFESLLDALYTNNIDVTVAAGIVDVLVETVDDTGVINFVGELKGISDNGVIENLPTGQVYDIYISAQTDAQFSTAASVLFTGPDYLVLAKRSGCLACHTEELKVVGPAWRDVSEKYLNDPAAEARLIAKIKSGGKGIWGEVPMPPYSPRVSDADIAVLVNNILKIAQ